MTGGKVAAYKPRAIGRVAGWSLCIIGITLITLLAGVGVAVVLSGQVASDQWNRLSDVGQTFGALSSIISGLAFAALVVTARIQFRDMQQNRLEIRQQVEFMARSQSELHRTAELHHVEILLRILKMSIDDPVLAEVWPEYEPGLSEEKNRQYLYANIIYQFNWASSQMNEFTEDQVLDNMRYLFTSRLMRDYWAATARGRKSLRPGSEEYEFSRHVDEICREFEHVAANITRTRLHRHPEAA
ncbi:DUF6082 family protein [Actinoplanes sp. NPDC051411]|uniref:DUF6082 family protein n=1 Tax=Actinoplanes sp. NPDC051411 TaxID=3155522 RepID=UPI0034260F46